MPSVSFGDRTGGVESELSSPISHFPRPLYSHSSEGVAAQVQSLLDRRFGRVPKLFSGCQSWLQKAARDPKLWQTSALVATSTLSLGWVVLRGALDDGNGNEDEVFQPLLECGGCSGGNCACAAQCRCACQRRKRGWWSRFKGFMGSSTLWDFILFGVVPVGLTFYEIAAFSLTPITAVVTAGFLGWRLYKFCKSIRRNFWY